MAPENHLDVEELPQVITPANSCRGARTPVGPASYCLFHDGAETLDLLLAELDPVETQLFDAALDLRSQFTDGSDATLCVEQLFRVRALLGGRHYLAFYRVRCWARRAFHVEVRASRGSPWLVHEFPLDGGRLDEIVNAALARVAAEGGVIPPTAHVRFAFTGSD